MLNELNFLPNAEDVAEMHYEFTQKTPYPTTIPKKINSTYNPSSTQNYPNGRNALLENSSKGSALSTNSPSTSNSVENPSKSKNSSKNLTLSDSSTKNSAQQFRKKLIFNPNQKVRMTSCEGNFSSSESDEELSDVSDSENKEETPSPSPIKVIC